MVLKTAQRCVGVDKHFLADILRIFLADTHVFQPFIEQRQIKLRISFPTIWVLDTQFLQQS
jgi:hypothetical protein